jgi:iron(III) transport system permease protein
MSRWRATIGLVVLLVVGVPVVTPFLQLLSLQGWEAWAEGFRLGALARNTAALVAGTLALALPVGTIGAVLLYRTDLPLRNGLRFFALLTLFVPLPLVTSAWQAALGTGGWLPVAPWIAPVIGDPDVEQTGAVWKPWGLGLGPAIWVHSVAGLPWAIVLVGQGLCWVERELEEDALTNAGEWRVLWRITLPRCRAAIVAAALWLALTAMTEITVSDMMQVRTFAEEVYTQFVSDRDAVPRAVAVSLPAVALTAACVLWVTQRWERRLPPLEALESHPRLIALGPARWLCLFGVLLVLAILVFVPLVSLLWKTGLGGNPQTWSLQVASHHFVHVLRTRGPMVLESLLQALVAGAFTAALGLVLCWLIVGSGWLRVLAFGLVALVWALPGPILGLGLKDTIAQILDLSHSDLLARVLWDGPSPLPTVWTHVIRFFPFALALMWPVLRLLPRDLRDAARVDGAHPLQELWYIVIPLSLPACFRATFAVAVLSLGELSASKLVETPGSQTFAHEVFNQMHYGVTNDLAALCLVLLAVVVLGAAAFAMVTRFRLIPSR